MHFLTQMGRKPWNISMFHYRNHGSDYGRVLIGLQVPQDERRKFGCFSSRWATTTARRPPIPRTACSCGEGSVGATADAA